jgi:hypothetical protein
MPQTKQAGTAQQKVGKKKKNVLNSGMKRIFIFGAGLLIVLLIFTFAQAAGRIPFFTENLLSLLVLVAILVQAYIYGGQWRVMQRQWIAMRRSLIHTRRIVGQNERVIEKMHESIEIERAKTNPRLRVSKVRMENFRAGQSPIFITTIANDGFIDATGVELHIGIRLGDGRAFQWIDTQTVTIPARGEESYPLVTGASLSEQDMQGFKTNVPIEVSVRIKILARFARDAN